MNEEDLIKENLEISVKKLEIIIERELGVTLDDFVLKEQRKDINDNAEEPLRRHHKRLIKMKRGKDMDYQ